MNCKYKIKFVDKVLDNVHGFIEFTEVEKKIIALPIFKRMQSIKQLSLANWIFPGAEHTRYIHSLGVMHIADLMALHLDYDDEKRQLIRLAGLLHDIGHYPLSHIGESAYKLELQNPENIIIEQKKFIEAEIMKLKLIDMDYMKKSSNPFHHERITEEVIKNDDNIKQIIYECCRKSLLINIDNICDIITGNVERNPELSGFVQLIHSELDADRIDYIMRDATFSGTSYGGFELGLLLRNLKSTEYKGVEIIGVRPKGVSIADQFLMSRYFSYTQVIFNRHVAILGFMAQYMIETFTSNNRGFPPRDLLLKYVKKHNGKDDFLYFTDRVFWDGLHNSPKGYSQYFDIIQERLLKYQELELSHNREVVFTSSNVSDMLNELKQSEIYKNLSDINKEVIAIFHVGDFTKQVPVKILDEKLNILLGNKEIDEKDIETIKIRRLQEGISVIEEGKEPRLLVDSNESIMHDLYATRTCILREYNFQ